MCIYIYIYIYVTYICFDLLIPKNKRVRTNTCYKFHPFCQYVNQRIGPRRLADKLPARRLHVTRRIHEICQRDGAGSPNFPLRAGKDGYCGNELDTLGYRAALGGAISHEFIRNRHQRSGCWRHRQGLEPSSAQPGRANPATIRCSESSRPPKSCIQKVSIPFFFLGFCILRLGEAPKSSRGWFPKQSCSSGSPGSETVCPEEP